MKVKIAKEFIERVINLSQSDRLATDYSISISGNTAHFKMKIKEERMAKFKVNISVKDVDIVKDLFALTKDIIDDLEQEGCYPATIKKYRDRLEKLIK